MSAEKGHRRNKLKGGYELGISLNKGKKSHVFQGYDTRAERYTKNFFTWYNT